MKFKAVVIVAFANLLLLGCKPEPAQAPAPSAQAVRGSTSEANAKTAQAPVSASPPTADVGRRPDYPKLVVKTFDGQQFDLSKQRGKWVVVNYWATWCNPCLKEIPDLDALDKARQDLVVIGLAYEEIERADMEAFLKDHTISYPIAVIDVYNPPADFETPKGLPMTYLIAPDGKVASRHLGPVTSDELSAEIKAAQARGNQAKAAPAA